MTYPNPEDRGRAASAARYRAKHRQEARDYWARYYERNADLVKAQHRERNRTRPLTNRDGVHRARARRFEVVCAHDECRRAGPLLLAWERYPHSCYLCGVPLTMGGNAEMDHVMPLSRSGLHCIDNVRPACAPCNQRKGATLP